MKSIPGKLEGSSIIMLSLYAPQENVSGFIGPGMLEKPTVVCLQIYFSEVIFCIKDSGIIEKK